MMHSAIQRGRRSAKVLAIVAIVGSVAVSVGRGTARGQSSADAGGSTLRVVMADPAYHGFDPQAAYTQAQFELLRCCLLRTLMTYRGVPDFPGTQPVPDLASGPPTISTDGRVWTFRLREGIRYAPPMDDVEITSADIVRALQRAGSDASGGGPGELYLAAVEGFTAYRAGDASAIAGVSTPDDHTLRVSLTRPDRSIAHVFALPFTAPIPPSPADPTAAFGVAEGHPFEATFDPEGYDGPDEAGYGPFLVASGPYMVEGAGDLDLSRPPDEQEPSSGFTPGWWFDVPGSMVLVRNPSWDRTTDPTRPAIADRIEISIAPAEDPYPALESGALDVIIGESPPPNVVREYRKSEVMGSLITTSAGNFSRFLTMNLAEPPFDDVHVRRAVALVIDRAAFIGSDSESPATHLVPDPMIGSLMSSWDAFPSGGGSPDLRSARQEMDASRYGVDGRCAGSACEDVLVVPPFDASPETMESIRNDLASIGIVADVREADCADPEAHVAICATGWFADFPDAGNMLVPFLSDGGFNPTMLGSAPSQLARWDYERRRLPSVDEDFQRCATTSGVEAAMCWARLDQLLTGELVALIPISSAEVIRLRGPEVETLTLDQAFGEPSLDRITPSG